MARKVGKRDSRYIAKLVVEDRAPCAFCHRQVDDEVTYGKLYAIGDIQCHYLCALLSCCLVQKGPEEEGLFGFMYKDILAELERSKKHKCSFCGCGGANLGCSVGSCRKQFHLPCGRERNAVSMFFGSFKTFCKVHAPKQRIPEHIMCKAKLRIKNERKKPFEVGNDNQSSDDDMVCVICYEAVDAFPTVNTFWPPCCARDAWFHRNCLQRMALSAGMHYLKCPLCNDKENFYDAVIGQGYYVPDRDAAWELEQNAFAEIYERPLTCTADSCQCPLGRSHDADQGMWDIKLCLLCGSVGAHAYCIGASETTRYVCITCTPAAPDDLQALADTIEKLILQEQALSASNVRSGPVMPSRMSLRRTKGRLALLNKPSSSRTHDIKTVTSDSSAQSPNCTNIQSTRQELNLRTPRRLMPTDTQRKSIQTNPYKNTEAKLSPNKSESFEKHTESYNKLDSNISTPTKLSKMKFLDIGSYKSVEASLLSPMKLLERSFNEKVLCMRGNNILDEKTADILRCRFNKPRPLSEKKKIISDILGGLYDDINNSLKQKDSVRDWCSPRKTYDIVKETETQIAASDVTKCNENSVENKENSIHETPKKSKQIKDTDMSQITSKNSEFESTERETDDNNEKHNEDNKNIEGTLNDSSNSSFELPSEFIAETLSDDSLTFPSPKRKTIDIKQDSSLEISEQDHSVNIDVIKLNDTDVSNTNVKKKCPFKFSPLNTEKLEKNDVGIDLESFKEGYLNEVDRQKCSFNHKHNHIKDTALIKKTTFRTAIDFAINAHEELAGDKHKKRKISESSLVLSFDKHVAKKRKMSVNDLDLSDDFEVKKELNLSQENKVQSPEKEPAVVQDKGRKINLKEKRRPRERNERRYNKSLRKIQGKDKNLIDRKIKNKERSNYDKEHDTNKLKNPSEKYVKNMKTNNNKRKLRDSDRKPQNNEKCANLKKRNSSVKHVNHRISSHSEEKELENEEINDLDSKSEAEENKLETIEIISKQKMDKNELKDSENHFEGGKLDEKSRLNRNEKRRTQIRSQCNKRKIDRKIAKEIRAKYKNRSYNKEKIHKDKLRANDKERDRRNHLNSDKSAKVKNRCSGKRDRKRNVSSGKNAKGSKSNDKQNIEVTIDSFKGKSNKKTKVSISNNEKDISVKIKWKKNQMRFKIESKKVEKDNSKFKQYVLQYFSEISPKEVLVKPEKEVSPLKRKYVKQEKTSDKFKQMSIQNFFRVKPKTEQEK